MKTEMKELLHSQKAYEVWQKYASDHMSFKDFIELCLKHYEKVHIDTYA